jgi:hypothetical protein
MQTATPKGREGRRSRRRFVETRGAVARWSGKRESERRRPAGGTTDWDGDVDAATLLLHIYI